MRNKNLAIFRQHVEVVRAEEVNQKRTLETTVRTRADCVAAGLDGVLASEEVPESGVDLLRGWVLLVQIGTDEVLTLHLSQLSYSAAHLVRWTEDGNKIVSLDFPITCTIHDFLTLFNCLYGFEFDLLSLGSALRAVLITSFLSTDDDIFVGIRKIISLSNQTLHDADVVRLFEIPAKKWGDTEIAEQGRSVLVMRAHYRSAGLTPHQRGWTDAG